MATHSSILAWGIPGTEGPGGLQSMGLDMTEQPSSHHNPSLSSFFLFFFSGKKKGFEIVY